jgi:hypothetical protein
VRARAWLEEFRSKLRAVELTEAMWLRLTEAERAEMFLFWRMSQLQQQVIRRHFDRRESVH